ncbi:hypothetical protein FOXB_16401 [Fusarium oxysporum f. sp. conglutinans Fo5176]|uniref:Uncharacterized protein n=2 Tax=Fusarium oxysporum f. sp. conglutinans TaxID=100902 RepID=F9GCL8_FUSOF|nr:hypothetical protein FOXB_16401 [Fusarium oxysporum f. sp. conglutinans Fo5176]
MPTAFHDPRIMALEVEHVLDKHILKDFMRDSVTGNAENGLIFMIVQKEINDAKNNVMQLHRTIAKRFLPFLLATAGKTKEEIEDGRSKVLSRIRAGFSVFRYMQTEETKDKLNKIVKDIRVQFKFAELVYNKKYPNERVSSPIIG